MNDYDTDSARDARRERLREVQPRAAPSMISTTALKNEYEDYHILLADRLPEIECGNRVMFCPACREPGKDPDLTKARKLYVSYDEDPLRNYAMLATLRCYGCGWQEIVPVEGAAVPVEGAAGTGANKTTPGGPFVPSLWSDRIGGVFSKNHMFSEQTVAGEVDVTPTLDAKVWGQIAKEKARLQYEDEMLKAIRQKGAYLTNQIDAQIMQDLHNQITSMQIGGIGMQNAGLQNTAGMQNQNAAVTPHTLGPPLPDGYISLDEASSFDDATISRRIKDYMVRKLGLK